MQPKENQKEKEEDDPVHYLIPYSIENEDGTTLDVQVRPTLKYEFRIPISFTKNHVVGNQLRTKKDPREVVK